MTLKMNMFERNVAKRITYDDNNDDDDMNNENYLQNVIKVRRRTYIKVDEHQLTSGTYFK